MSLFEKSARREAKVAGIRLVGIFVPWQAVALTLAVVMGLTSVALLRSGSSTVRVEQSAATNETSSTTTTEPPTTTTTEPPTTTTTADLPARVVYIEKRVDEVDKRVAVIEATTTTTTTVPPPPTEPTVTRGYEYWTNIGEQSSSDNSGYGGARIIRFATDVYKPGLKVRFLYLVKGGVQEFVADFDHPHVPPENASLDSGPKDAVYVFSSSEVDNFWPNNDAYFKGIVGWEWDGGSKRGPAAP